MVNPEKDGGEDLIKDLKEDVMEEEDKEEFKEYLKSFEDMGETMAKTIKSYYDNLIKEGFSKEDAMKIITRCDKE